MKTRIFFGAILIALIIAASSCQAPSRTMELSIPLNPAPAAAASDPAVQIETKPINPLDVLVAVETVAANNGLKPWTEAAEGDDILGVADPEDSSSGSVQNWRHPEYPIYLTATRHKSEILLLLNYPPESEPDPKAQKLFNTIKSQLTAELQPYLTPAPAAAK